MSKQNDKNQATIEQKLEQLRQLAAWFESDEFALQAASDKFEEARKLADDIIESLDSLENTVRIVKDSSRL